MMDSVHFDLSTRQWLGCPLAMARAPGPAFFAPARTYVSFYCFRDVNFIARTRSSALWRDNAVLQSDIRKCSDLQAQAVVAETNCTCAPIHRSTRLLCTWLATRLSG
jgi:hypothetical protein